MQWRQKEGLSNLVSGVLAWVAGIVLEIQPHLMKTCEGRCLQELYLLPCFIRTHYGIVCLSTKLYFFLLHLIFFLYFMKWKEIHKVIWKTHLSFYFFLKKEAQNVVFLVRVESISSTIASRQPPLFWFRNQWYQPFGGTKKPRRHLKDKITFNSHAF